MELVKWRTEYELGHPALDAEHRHLVTLINQAIGAVELKQESNLEPLLNTLFAYARSHFAHEERLMISAGYPDLHDHVREHHTFYEGVSDLYSRFLSGESNLALILTTFLRDWLLEHIQGTDRLYVPYLTRPEEG